MLDFIKNEHIRQAVQQILIAILIALLGLLGYHVNVAQPMYQADHLQLGALNAGETNFSSLELSDFLAVAPQTPVAVAASTPVTPLGSAQPLTAAAAVTVTDISLVDAGTFVDFYNTATNTITISGSATVDVVSNRALTENDHLLLFCDGSTWYEVSTAAN